MGFLSKLYSVSIVLNVGKNHITKYCESSMKYRTWKILYEANKTQLLHERTLFYMKLKDPVYMGQYLVKFTIALHPTFILPTWSNWSLDSQEFLDKCFIYFYRQYLKIHILKLILFTYYNLKNICRYAYGYSVGFLQCIYTDNSYAYVCHIV